MNKYFYKPYMAVVLCVLSVNPSVQADEHSIHIKINTQTGAINQLILDHDPQNMNWILQTDGSQYPWIKENYGWGLGYLPHLILRGIKKHPLLSKHRSTGWETYE